MLTLVLGLLMVLLLANLKANTDIFDRVDAWFLPFGTSEGVKGGGGCFIQCWLVYTRNQIEMTT